MRGLEGEGEKGRRMWREGFRRGGEGRGEGVLTYHYHQCATATLTSQPPPLSLSLFPRSLLTPDFSTFSHHSLFIYVTSPSICSCTNPSLSFLTFAFHFSLPTSYLLSSSVPSPTTFLLMSLHFPQFVFSYFRPVLSYPRPSIFFNITSVSFVLISLSPYLSLLLPYLTFFFPLPLSIFCQLSPFVPPRLICSLSHCLSFHSSHFFSCSSHFSFSPSLPFLLCFLS